MKEIELSTYLSKVGLNETNLRNLSPVERLNAIYVAHILTFPYSNIKLRQQGSQHPLQRNLYLADYKNVFSEPSGGYCYQLAALLKDILIKFEYQVDACEARVLMGAEVNATAILKLPPTHLVLNVTIEGQSYFLDPGLGSQAPRLPIVVRGNYEPVIQSPDEFRFYYLEQEKLYVLERRTENGWLTLIQTNLSPLKQDKIESNLMKLVQHFPTLAIRDDSLFMGRILPQGRRSLFWFAATNQLKYTEKTTIGYEEKVLEDYDEAVQVVHDKFNIKTTPEELKQSCTSNKDKKGFLFFNHKPEHPWTVEFPLDKHTILSMRSKLVSNGIEDELLHDDVLSVRSNP